MDIWIRMRFRRKTDVELMLFCARCGVSITIPPINDAHSIMEIVEHLPLWGIICKNGKTKLISELVSLGVKVQDEEPAEK